MTIKTIIYKSVFSYENEKSIVSKRRARRICPLLEMIQAAATSRGTVSILDIGGTAEYWRVIPQEYLLKYHVKITILNLPGRVATKADDIFTFVYADAVDLSGFEDKHFDIAHSNSVIEHVGDWGRMVKFANELSRVSRQHFVQTPNFWFPIEPHFMTIAFHWLPEPTRVWMILRYKLGSWERATSMDQAVRAIESARLLNKRMFQALFKESEIRTERFLGLPKSLIAIRKFE